tara:strand:+ start:398 stop:880 length:483 start_codon:yes stop_codon:yes gene_type:complete
MKELVHKKIINLILSFSIIAIIFAFYVEIVLGHKPCNLCLLERIPYMFVIILITILLFFKSLEKITFGLMGLTFLIATLLSLYHVGIEQGIIQESAVCNSSSGLDIINKEDLLKDLSNERISCKIVTFTVFGLSLATINAFVSLVISFITFKIFLSYEKK